MAKKTLTIIWQWKLATKLQFVKTAVICEVQQNEVCLCPLKGWTQRRLRSLSRSVLHTTWPFDGCPPTSLHTHTSAMSLLKIFFDSWSTVYPSESRLDLSAFMDLSVPLVGTHMGPSISVKQPIQQHSFPIPVLDKGLGGARLTSQPSIGSRAKKPPGAIWSS